MAATSSATGFASRPQGRWFGLPLQVSRSVDEVVVRLLITLSPARVRWMRSGQLQGAQGHHAAVLAAMHTAFEAFLDRVEPKDLEERFDRAAKKSMFGGQNKSKYWTCTPKCSGPGPSAADGFPHLFIESLPSV